MAQVAETSVSAEKESNKSKEYDPKLDFFSKEFDPLKVLCTPGVLPPIINAKAYDNLAKYTSVKINLRPEIPKQTETAGSSTVERRWLPHQRKFHNAFLITVFAFRFFKYI